MMVDLKKTKLESLGLLLRLLIHYWGRFKAPLEPCIVQNPKITILGMSHIDSLLTQPQLPTTNDADKQLDESMTNSTLTNRSHNRLVSAHNANRNITPFSGTKPTSYRHRIS